jgi:hypothetical protein
VIITERPRRIREHQKLSRSVVERRNTLLRCHLLSSSSKGKFTVVFYNYNSILIYIL